MFYELAADTWGPEEIKAIEDVIASGRYTIGPKVAQFETAFAEYFGCRHAVMVNSGSSANLIAVASLFFKKERPLLRGDEVIVPAISWSTTYHPLQQYGLKLRFVDVEIETLNMDVAALEEALTPETRAIVGVSILGNPAALDVMRDFAAAHDLYFIEDNCESMDAELAGRKTGTFGHLNTYSTFFSHHMSTIEGGVVLTDDTELAHLCRSLRAHGWTRDLPDDSELFEKTGRDFDDAYQFILPGYNVRPQEINAAVGLVQLAKLPAMTERRRENLALFQALFADDPRYLIQREHGKSSAFCFTIVPQRDSGIERKDILPALAEADIGFRMVTGGCFLRHENLKFYDYSCVGDIANANYVHDQGFFVGNHPLDLSPQIEKLHAILNQF